MRHLGDGESFEGTCKRVDGWLDGYWLSPLKRVVPCSTYPVTKMDITVFKQLFRNASYLASSLFVSMVIRLLDSHVVARALVHTKADTSAKRKRRKETFCEKSTTVGVADDVLARFPPPNWEKKILFQITWLSSTNRGDWLVELHESLWGAFPSEFPSCHRL